MNPPQPRWPLALVLCVAAAGCQKPADSAPVAASARAPLVTAPTRPGSPTAAAAPATAAPAPAHADAAGIDWRHAASDADVDAVFAQARAQAKPVFVYWGAKWCPPCNQVKATLFNRQDFIERSRAFVPVYVDGDSPGAQKLGTRFNVSGYPTMVLFSPQGTELTRLPGEVDPGRYTEVLTLGMNAAQRPVKDVLALARTGGQGLGPNDWRMLAFYSWDTDQQQLAPRAGVPALLRQLAAACPADQADTATRLRLKALAAADDKAPPRPDAKVQAMLVRLLADAEAARSHIDVLTNSAADITRTLSAKGSPQRAELLDAFDAALKRFGPDTRLSRADRIGALIARVDLATIDAPKDDAKPTGTRAPPRLEPALLDDIRSQTSRADREITDGYERQAVITACAYLLQHAGLGSESDALLQANLAKSHSPYYLMSELAANAKARGDKEGALRWSQQAFERSEGPATRLQWGASYVNALIELAPNDEGRIEQAVGQLFAEAAALPDAFYERSGRSLQRVGKKLLAWNARGAHAGSIRRLQARLDGVCAGLDAADPKRAGCAALLKPAPASAA